MVEEFLKGLFLLLAGAYVVLFPLVLAYLRGWIAFRPRRGGRSSADPADGFVRSVQPWNRGRR